MYGEDCALGELVLEGGIGGVQPVAQTAQRFLTAVEETRLVGRCQRLGAAAGDPREGRSRLQRCGEDQLVVLPRGGLGQGEQLRNNVALALGDRHDRARPAALLGDHGGEEFRGTDRHPRLVGADLGADLVVLRADLEFGSGHARFQLAGVLGRVPGVNRAGNLFQDAAELGIHQDRRRRSPARCGGRRAGDGAGVWLAWAATPLPATAVAVSTATTTPERRRRCAAVAGAAASCSEAFFGVLPFVSAPAGAVPLEPASACPPRGPLPSLRRGSRMPCVLRPWPGRGGQTRCRRLRRRRNRPPEPEPPAPVRVPDLGLSTSSAAPARISRPPMTMSGMAHGVEVSFGKVMVMDAGAGLVPSDREQQRPVAVGRRGPVVLQFAAGVLRADPEVRAGRRRCGGFPVSMGQLQCLAVLGDAGDGVVRGGSPPRRRRRPGGRRPA